MTSDGAFIVLVLNCPEENLKKIAQKIELNKTLDFSLTDFMSLEPIDSRFRPFRTNKVLYSKRDWDLTYERGNVHPLESDPDAGTSNLLSLTHFRNPRNQLRKNCFENCDFT